MQAVTSTILGSRDTLNIPATAALLVGIDVGSVRQILNGLDAGLCIQILKGCCDKVQCCKSFT